MSHSQDHCASVVAASFRLSNLLNVQVEWFFVIVVWCYLYDSCLDGMKPKVASFEPEESDSSHFNDVDLESVEYGLLEATCNHSISQIFMGDFRASQLYRRSLHVSLEVNSREERVLVARLVNTTLFLSVCRLLREY